MTIEPSVVRATGIVVLNGFIFWRLVRRYRGDKFILCGSITILLFLVMMTLSRIPQINDDYTAWLAVPLFVLCVLSIFYLFQQLYSEHKQRSTRRYEPKS
jgi:amino acid transporter